MSNSIKDLIFEGDATLFEVLDNLDVPDLLGLKSNVDTNTNLLTEYKIQLDALAKKQDNFEATTTANFISLNTQIEQLNESMIVLQTNVDNVRSDISRLDNGQYQLEQSVSLAHEKIQALDTSLSDLYFKVNTLEGQDIVNRENIKTLQANVTTLQAATVTGVKVLKGRQHLFMWDYANNRVTDTNLDLNNYMLMGVSYNSLFSTDWLRGYYDWTLTCTRDSTTPYTGTSPVVSGQFYWFNWRARNDTAWFHVQVYFYT